MNGILKLSLFVLLVITFFALPEGGNALKCFSCVTHPHTGNKDDPCTKSGVNSIDCDKDHEHDPYDVCRIDFKTKDDVVIFAYRLCSHKSGFLDIKIGNCITNESYEITESRNEKFKTCICATNNCNSPFPYEMNFSFITFATNATTIMTSNYINETISTSIITPIAPMFNSQSICLTGCPMVHLLVTYFGVILHYGFI